MSTRLPLRGIFFGLRFVAFQSDVDLPDEQLISCVEIRLGDCPAIHLDECAFTSLKSQTGVVSGQQSCVPGFHRGVFEANAGRGLGSNGGRKGREGDPPTGVRDQEPHPRMIEHPGGRDQWSSVGRGAVGGSLHLSAS